MTAAPGRLEFIALSQAADASCEEELLYPAASGQQRGLFPRLRRSRLDFQARGAGLSGGPDAPASPTDGLPRPARDPQPRRVAP